MMLLAWAGLDARLLTLSRSNLIRCHVQAFTSSQPKHVLRKECMRVMSSMDDAHVAPVTPHYSQLPIDRAGDIRKDVAKLKQFSESSQGKYVLLHNYTGFLRRTDKSQAKYSTAYCDRADLPDSAIDQDTGLIFLGLDSKKLPYFAAHVTDQFASKIAEERKKLRREGGPNLGAGDAALIAYAAGMVTWARKNMHSTQSGHRMAPLQGGHARAAEGERSVFSRIDPAVIMAVTSGEWMLLGRQSKWSSGRFSLLAGFCEVGETLEQAVVRETLEEAGVKVRLESVRYHSSQPWPFPQTLMIGFTSEVDNLTSIDDLPEEALGAIEKQGLTDEEVEDAFLSLPPAPSPDQNELEAAFWFHRSFVKDSLEGNLAEGVVFAIPGPHALANSIISQWAKVAVESKSWSGQNWPTVAIDYGRFKYILLRLKDRSGNSKLIVRGDKSKEYHADILEVVQDEAKAVGLEVEVLGGGRIENGIMDIKVFGHSMAFGAAPHEITATLLKRRYPMATITTSYAGY